LQKLANREKSEPPPKKLFDFGLDRQGCDRFRFEPFARLELSDYPNITFSQISSLPVPEILTGKAIGLLHLDTEHSYAQVENEWGQYQGYLSKPAIVIFDDLHAMDDDVKRFFDKLPFDKIQDDELHPSCGWGVVLYE